MTKYFKNFNFVGYNFGNNEEPVIFNNLTQYVDVLVYRFSWASFFLRKCCRSCYFKESNNWLYHRLLFSCTDCWQAFSYTFTCNRDGNWHDLFEWSIWTHAYIKYFSNWGIYYWGCSISNRWLNKRIWRSINCIQNQVTYDWKKTSYSKSWWNSTSNNPFSKRNGSLYPVRSYFVIKLIVCNVVIM